jgi:transketolase C-terminal domain/subunit
MSEELLYWQALNRAMDAELAADSSVFTLGEDVGLYGGSYRVTEGLYAKYGEWRVRDTPISENSFTGLGVGAALVGLRPVVEIMTINFMRCSHWIPSSTRPPRSHSCRAVSSPCRWSCASPAGSRASSGRNILSG